MENKKPKEVAALQYKKGEAAPKVIATGKGAVAENILKLAKEHDIPIYEDAKLAHLLNFVEIGNEIPQDLYEIVAKILIFVCEIDKIYSQER